MRVPVATVNSGMHLTGWMDVRQEMVLMMVTFFENSAGPRKLAKIGEACRVPTYGPVDS